VLINRVKAVLRRARPQPEQLPDGPSTYQIQGAVFDPELNEIVGHDVRVRLTPTESCILHLLFLHEGQVLSAERIMERIWGYDSQSDINVIKTHIRNLREKISSLPNSPLREKLSRLLAQPEQWPTGSPRYQIAGQGVRNEALTTRILCVDADKQLVDLLAQALEREGFVVLTAYDGWDALRLAWEERPDLVVLDANMPDMDGFDVLPMLRSFSRVPVIMLTDGADNVNRRADPIGHARFVRGADDYVAKPFSPDVLISRIRVLLRERRQPPGGSET
jgi:DNA-binding response OmpR family regulator